MVTTTPHFENEPLLDLRHESARADLRDALAALDHGGPAEVPVVIAGESRVESTLASSDPGSPDRIVAMATVAEPREVDRAVECAARGGARWGARTAAERAATLAAAAEILRERRRSLTALTVRECGKPWPEADADVCEAIDFLEYYGREALRLDAGVSLEQAPGERNAMRFFPRGVVAVIAPWNFPLAIVAGMTGAALAAGNGVVLKPAEQAPRCGWEIVQALLDAGVDPEAISLLPGEGDVGAALTAHPDVHVIAFTGSAAVGLEILERAATKDSRRRHVKRVVAEMGGKNCIVVDSDADLDDAVPAISYSAFGFAGQKCSAASRVLVHESAAEGVVERLRGALEVLTVDRAERFGVDVPPVIEEAAQSRIEEQVAIAASAGATVIRGDAGPGAGWFVAPTIVLDIPPGAEILSTELFGPVVTVEVVQSVDEACALLNEMPVALTAGLFSRNPRTVEHVSSRVPAGNLYINRHITGAMVGRQPFGGNRLSGTGAKAGGPGYLENFLESRVVTENTVRHGMIV